ncbi:TetR/AcrR family transcriptional regulator [Aureibacillus halotolerans]|nr:TetR/AcrR family transcriptional regulator [Aureibacillus halotolerans]
MSGYERRTQAKKEAIINAVWELFTKRGVTDVSISEIAAKANVSQVSIYNYFGSKNALAKEVLLSYMNETIKGYEALLDMDLPFAEKLTLIMDKKQSATDEISHSAFSQMAWEDKTFQEIYKEIVHTKAISIYMKFIELGKKEGALDENIPNEAILAFLLSSVAVTGQAEYLQTSTEYKRGILKLYSYGLFGKGE